MKRHTDLEQSEKLAEILPIESADMFLSMNGILLVMSKYIDNGLVTADETAIPCWSLTALFDVLRTFTTPTAFSVKVSATSLIKTKNGYKLTYAGDYTPMINNKFGVEAPIESVADNAIDCCVNMIIKLHELNLL